MVEERDIVALSLPFVAGVALAAVLGHSTVVSAVVFPLSILLLVFASLVKRRAWMFPLLFFLLGAACWSIDDCTRAQRPGTMPFLHFAGDALDGLCALVDSLPFRSERTSPLLQALLAGRRELLDRGTVMLFRRSGAAHMLALSGLHLGVVSSVVSRILSILGHTPAMMVIRSCIVVLFSAFYVLMTGASPSLVRAFIFIISNELAKLLPGRDRSPLRIFCMAVTIQLAFTPSVISSVAFQLSYLAMLGLVTVFPAMDSWYPDTGLRGLDRVNVPRRIWTSVSLSVSCQLFTFPLMWHYFHTFPKYFMITNLLALPLTELTIVAALPVIALGALGVMPEQVAAILDWSAGKLLGCLEVIASM